jgi:hypothetical protein
VSDCAQQGDRGLFVLVEIDLDHGETDEEFGVAGLRVDGGGGLAESVLHAA